MQAYPRCEAQFVWTDGDFSKTFESEAPEEPPYNKAAFLKKIQVHVCFIWFNLCCAQRNQLGRMDKHFNCYMDISCKPSQPVVSPTSHFTKHLEAFNTHWSCHSLKSSPFSIAHLTFFSAIKRVSFGYKTLRTIIWIFKTFFKSWHVETVTQKSQG